MKQVNQDKIKKIISIILLVIWCLLIFYFSDQKGSISENSSGYFINFLNKIFNLFNINILDIKNISFIIRKIAHMFLYFILYILIFNLLNTYNLKNKFSKAFMFSLIYATFDEIHQLFVIGRSFQIRDIFIDMIGASLAFVIIKLIKKE